MKTPKLPWSADVAVQQMWSEHTAHTGSVVQALFRKHLQKAYEAGLKDSFTKQEMLELTKL